MRKLKTAVGPAASAARREIARALQAGLDRDGGTRAWLARTLGVTPGRVTHMLDPDHSFTLRLSTLEQVYRVCGARYLPPELAAFFKRVESVPAGQKGGPS